MNRLLSLGLLVSAAATAGAQQYGMPFWTENFDTQQALEAWSIMEVQNTSGEEAPELFSYAPDSESGFSSLESSSTGSLAVTGTKKVGQALVSPWIDATEKSNLVVGCFGRNISDLGAFLGFQILIDAHIEGEVNADGSDKWELTVLNPTGSRISLADDDWVTAYSILADKYAGTRFRLRIRSAGGMVYEPERVAYIDGLYVAEKPAVEAEAKKLTPADNAAMESMLPVDVTLRVTNNGTAPLSGFKVWYGIDGGEKIEQTVSEIIEPGQYADIMFEEKASFVTPERQYLLEAGVDAEGDGWNFNDRLSSTVKNMLATLPYTPDFGYGESKFDSDGWVYPSVPNGRWTTANALDAHYWRANMSSRDEQSGLLKSRPIVVNGGEALKLGFKASVDMSPQGSEGTKDETLTGGIRVYYTYDKEDVESYRLLTENQQLTYDRPEQLLYFTPEEDGVIYVVFQSATPANSWNTKAWVRLEDIYVKEAPEYDLELLGILSPVPGEETYSAAEEVRIAIVNNGTRQAEGADVALYVDGEKVALESLPSLSPGSETEYTFEYHPALLGASHTVRAAVEWTPDQNADNNEASVTVEPERFVDLEVVSIDGPRSGELGSEEYVAVTLAHKGKGDLENVEVTMHVSLEPDGQPTEVKEVCAGRFEEGSRISYTFSTPVDLSSEGTYSVTVSLVNALDATPSDNVKTTKINCTRKILDAGIEAVTGPTDRRMTTAENIVVRVRNYGDADLYDVPVSAIVSRDGVEIATVEGHVPEVKAGESVEYVIPGDVDLWNGGTYQVQARTLLAADGDASNDVYEGEIYAWMLDCGVESIVSPATEVEEGMRDITVRIRNYGDDTVSDIPVYFRLGGNPQRGLYEGSIAAGESADYTFPSKYNFRAGRSYTLTAYTECPDDMDSSNDSFSIDITAVKDSNGVESFSADGTAEIRIVADGIEVAGLAEGTTISLYGASGICLGTQVSAGRPLRFDAPDGVWYLRLQLGERETTVKIVK